MLLKQRSTQILLEVITLHDLFDPFEKEITGTLCAGEEIQDAEQFKKSDLVFPSDESLPACWINPDYRHQMVGMHNASRQMAGTPNARQ